MVTWVKAQLNIEGTYIQEKKNAWDCIVIKGNEIIDKPLLNKERKPKSCAELPYLIVCSSQGIWIGWKDKYNKIKFVLLLTFSKGNYAFPTQPNANSTGIILLFIVFFAQIKHLSRSSISRIFNIAAFHYGKRRMFILVRLSASPHPSTPEVGA